MIYTTKVALSLLAALATITEAAPVSKKSKVAPVAIDFKVIKENTFKKYSKDTKLPKSQGYRLIENYQNTHSITIPNEGSYFLAQLKIGSDDQELGVIVDTGSSDLWFPSKSSCEPSKTVEHDSTLSGLPAESSSCPLGAFDQTESSSFQDMNKNFSLYYGVEGYYTYAKGIWAKETVTWGDVTVKDMQFGLATDQDIGQGIIGISYNGTEGVYPNEEYPNFPMQLKSQGIVDKNAYSLYLNSPEAESGTILFGGIDEAKFDGDLTYFDTVHVNDGGISTKEAVAFFVNLDGVTESGNQLVNESYPALLDSGSTLLYAPPAIYKEVAPKYGEYNETIGGYITPCSSEGEDFKFQFKNLTINVPYKNLLYNVSDDTSLFTNADGTEMCMFSLLTTSENTWILGDIFLRSAYIYYDLDDSKIGLAQAKYTTESKIVSV